MTDASLRGPSPLRTAIGALLVLLGIGIGLTGMHVAAVHEVEIRLGHWFVTHRVPPLDLAARVVHVVFGPIVAPVSLAVVCLFLAVRRRVDLAIEVGLLIGLGWAVAALPKLFAGRVRPMESQLFPELGADSFASGHTAFAVALAVTVVVVLRRAHRRWVPAALGLGAVAVCVALLRMYAGVHWLTDVTASWALATGTVLVLGPLVHQLRALVARLVPAWCSPRMVAASRKAALDSPDHTSDAVRP